MKIVLKRTFCYIEVSVKDADIELKLNEMERIRLVMALKTIREADAPETTIIKLEPKS